MLFRLVTAHYIRLVEYASSRGSESRELSMYSKRAPSLSFFPFFLFFFFSLHNISPLHGDAAVERNDLKSWMKASIKFASDRHLRRNRNVWPTVANEWPKEKCCRRVPVA